MHKRWISLLQQICCTDYMHTCKYKQLKVIGFVLNRGSSLKLHSLLTPSRPVHPQHLQQTTQTHTHMNTLHISQPFFPQPHTFTWIHLHANTHILTEGCMCWSLVVCSHVFSVVDATRHTKASWGFFKKKGTGAESSNHLRRFTLWIGDKNYGMCSESLDKTDTHNPSQSTRAFYWWLKLSLRPEQPMTTPVMLWHTALFIVLKVKIHQSLFRFFLLLATK